MQKNLQVGDRVMSLALAVFCKEHPSGDLIMSHAIARIIKE